MSDDTFEANWNVRVNAMASILGAPGDRVYHGLIPLNLGGSADVVPFPGHAGGIAYATSDLIGDAGQAANDLGEYELVICHRSPSDWGPSVLSRLAPYTLEAQLNPGETMEIGPSVPQPSKISAFLFVEYGRFQVLARQCGLLLCLGITTDELETCWKHGPDYLLERLKERGVFPFTDLARDSVLPVASY